jgi:hypothetical protein
MIGLPMASAGALFGLVASIHSRLAMATLALVVESRKCLSHIGLRFLKRS